MFLRMKTSIVGRNFVYQPDDIVEWQNEEEALRLVERNCAERIRSAQDADKVSMTSGKVIKTHNREQPSEAAMRPAAVTR